MLQPQLLRGHYRFGNNIVTIIKNKNIDTIKFFEKIGSEIGLLFQIAADLIDYRGDSKRVGKKTKKDL